MRKKYTYCETYSSKIEQYLKEKRINYKIVGDDHIVPKMISFIIYDDFSNDIKQILKHGSPIITNEFTQKELQSADYLTLRAVKQVIEIINVSDAFQFKCPRRTINGGIKYEHKEQIKELMIKKRFISKGSTCFFSSSNGFSELFVKEEICDLLQKDDIKGIIFKPVKVLGKEPNNESGLLQVLSQRVIKKEVMCFDENQQIKKCPICGQEKIVCNQDYQLRLKDLSTNYLDDFYMTDAVFGDGIPNPLFLISKKLYYVLSSNRMLSNVYLAPVIFDNRI